jgi:hypothetical protein
MKRVLFYFLLFFAITQASPIFAQSPSPLPSGAIMSGDGILIPGVTCGIAGDPDPGKTKCCVPKRPDNSYINTISDFATGLPFVGGYVRGWVDKVDAYTSMQNNMSPCVGDPTKVVPSTPNELTNKTCICIPNNPSSNTVPQLADLCKKYFPLSATSNEIQKCSQCINSGEGFYTAIGCIPLNISTFISYLLTTGIGVAGGIALLCIMYSAFRMQTSMGNAEAIKKAQESMTACITGLIVIIFSVLILKIIGVDILRIPGFGK